MCGAAVGTMGWRLYNLYPERMLCWVLIRLRMSSPKFCCVLHSENQAARKGGRGGASRLKGQPGVAINKHASLHCLRPRSWQRMVAAAMVRRASCRRTIAQMAFICACTKVVKTTSTTRRRALLIPRFSPSNRRRRRQLRQLEKSSPPLADLGEIPPRTFHLAGWADHWVLPRNWATRQFQLPHRGIMPGSLGRRGRRLFGGSGTKTVTKTVCACHGLRTASATFPAKATTVASIAVAASSVASSSSTASGQSHVRSGVLATLLFGR